MKTQLPKNRLGQAGPVSSVVLVTCVDEAGKANIITLGMFMSISSNPYMVCIGVAPERYSHDLIMKQGEFVVNSPGIDLKEKLHLCGIKSGRDIDKFKEIGLTPLKAQVVKPPLIKECYGHLECRLVSGTPFGDHTLIVGEVVAASIDEEKLKDGRLDLSKAKPIAQKNWDYHTLDRL